MVTAERFSQISGSYWSSLLPQLSNFVSLSNQGAQQFAPPLRLESEARRRPIVSETAFVMWKNQTDEGAEEEARQRLAAVWNQVPISGPLSAVEWRDVREIGAGLEAIRGIDGIKSVQIEPALAGCGFIASGVPDFTAQVDLMRGSGSVLGEVKMVERPFRSVDYRQVVCYLVLYYAQFRTTLDYLWLVNPIRGLLVHIEVDSFFMLVRGQSGSEAVAELLYEWSSPSLSP